jgi:hypothetical protein
VWKELQISGIFRSQIQIFEVEEAGRRGLLGGNGNQQTITEDAYVLH